MIENGQSRSLQRCYLRLRSWFSWSTWCRWLYGFEDCEIAARAENERRFLVVADTPEAAIVAVLVPRLGERCPDREGVCVALRVEVWVPDLGWTVTAIYNELV